MSRVGDILTITVDLGVKGDMSKSGKSIVLASTEGNQKITPEPTDKGSTIFAGINIYKI